jgi:hypothetical protein
VYGLGCKKLSSKMMIAVALSVLILAATARLLAGAATSTSQMVPSKGKLTVLNVGVYSNSGCTQNATIVDWGSLTAGLTSNAMVWVKNTGNSKVTLSMTTKSWLPASASSWITLAWNHEGKVLAPNQTVQANLVLKVSSSIDQSITDFTFNIVMAGTA